MYGFVASYLEAGADMISTATYQASIMGFVKHLSVSSSDAEQLLRKAVSICVTARDNFWRNSENHAGRTPQLCKWRSASWIIVNFFKPGKTCGV